MKEITEWLGKASKIIILKLAIWDEESLHAIRESSYLKRFGKFFKTCTYLGDGWLWGLLALCIMIFDDRRFLILLIGFSIVWINKLIVVWIKHSCKRPRPKPLPPNIRSKIVQEYSFPSGHSADSFGIAFLICHFYPFLSIQVGIFLVSFLISFSRIYVGEHYPTDVITGGILGIIMSNWLFTISEKVMVLI